MLRCGRRIAFPFGGTPPPARELSACPFVNSRQGILARHLGWSFEALEAFLEPPGVPLRPSWSLLGRSWEPKIDQNRTQNESKFKTIFKSEKVALQESLGAVLGRPILGYFGGHLWVQKSAPVFENVTFGEHLRF